MTSAARNENRLTPDDRTRMAAAVTGAVEAWRANSGPTWTPDATTRLALQRIAAHAIGCTVDDLRGSERDEIDALTIKATR